MIKPVYVFSGFLDSGKTTAIKNTLLDTRFNQGESTLIIAFEQGDVEYDGDFLKKTNTQAIYLDSVKDLTIEKQKEIDSKYNVERIFIEFNGMEDDNILYENGFIQEWELAQTLTTCDASTFNMYLQNMKQFVYNHVKNAEVVILNRADNLDKRYLRNNLKSINTRLEIIFEDINGNVSNKIEDELFDVSHDLIIDDIDYGLWYMDALDNPRKYKGKTITIKVKLAADVKEYEDVLIMGRKAMVCCAEDITDIAITCCQMDKSKIEKDQYYSLKGKIKVMRDTSGYETCVLYVDECTKADAPEQELVTFN